jgi:hypothetical protein
VTPELPLPTGCSLRWPADRIPWGAALVILITLGCGADTDPMGPDVGPEEGFIVIEGDPNFATNSVSWTGSAVATDRFSFISVALDASTNGPSHFLYEAPFHQRGCLDARCFPSAEQIFVLPGLTIENLDLSPQGDVETFDGRRRGDSNFWIHLYEGGGEPRLFYPGFEPTFLPDGSAVLYVSSGRDELIRLDPTNSSRFVEAYGLTGVAHPRVSPDGRFTAYSAIDVQRNSRRIWVHDRENPDLFADPVSLPDIIPGGGLGDGTNDDYPAWSPAGRFLAYRGKMRRNVFSDTIFITEPAEALEQPIRIADVSPGREMTYLRWHPNGTLLLLILDGDVYSLAVPERYHDP